MFAYLPNGANVKDGDAATMYITMTNTSPRCTMSFWYSMYGSGIGTLEVVGDGSTVWTKSG